MSVRRTLATFVALCAALMLVPVAAGAATTSPTPVAAHNFNSSIPVNGKAKNGKKFKGHYTIHYFTHQNGTVYAVGLLTGKLGNRSVRRDDVMMPVSGPKKTGAHDAQLACNILNLTLGPLHLNLLGLVVDIPNPIVLNITAVPGAGNLLGNLLCGVTNLLNGTGAGGTALTPAQLSAVLNVVDQLLGTNGLTAVLTQLGL